MNRHASSLRGLPVTVMGLGRHGGGVAVARYLALQGAAVTVTDLLSAEELADSLTALQDLPIARYRLQTHDPDDFRDAAWVVVNPAVPPRHPLLEIASQAGARLTSEIEIFLEVCPAPVVSVTGTTGKSTTASLLSAILSAAGQPGWLGGNIGQSLLGELARIDADDTVILELSSFQLAQLSRASRWPGAALITNWSPHHLAWHGSPSNYAAAKQELVRRLPSDGWAILPPWDAEVRAWREFCPAPLVEPWPLDQIPPLRLLGEHNRRAAAIAAAAAARLGIDETSIAKGLTALASLPHRLERFGSLADRYWVDDSKATTRAATAAAVASFGEPVWLVVGGIHSERPGPEWMAQVLPHLRGVTCFGPSAERLAAGFAQHGLLTAAFDDLAAATSWCFQQSLPGQTILLSPGGVSHDQYPDFAARGDHFRAVVQELAKGG